MLFSYFFFISTSQSTRTTMSDNTTLSKTDATATETKGTKRKTVQEPLKSLDVEDNAKECMDTAEIDFIGPHSEDEEVTTTTESEKEEPTSKQKEYAFQCKKLKKEATPPLKAHSSDAGFDLFAFICDENEDGTLKHDTKLIKPGETVWINTMTSVSIPQGYVGIVKGRSSLTQLVVNAGVIDSGYRGEIKISVSYPVTLKEDQPDFALKHGQKIAQLVILKIHHSDSVQLVEEFEDAETERGEKGFGSTGK